MLTTDRDKRSSPPRRRGPVARPRPTDTRGMAYLFFFGLLYDGRQRPAPGDGRKRG